MASRVRQAHARFAAGRVACRRRFWITKTTKGRESRETRDIPFVSFASFASFVIQTPLHHPNFLLRQPIQPIHQPINLPVGGLDLALVELLVGGGSGSRKPRKGAKAAKLPFVPFAFIRAIRVSNTPSLMNIEPLPVC